MDFTSARFPEIAPFCVGENSMGVWGWGTTSCRTKRERPDPIVAHAAIPWYFNPRRENIESSCLLN